MGHGPAVSHGTVFSGPQSLIRKQYQHSNHVIVLTSYFLVIVVGPPSYFIILVSHEQKKVEKPWHRYK